jgi:HNH endonuclease
MANRIITYQQMCDREGTSLQRGMNFRLGRTHSVILMSIRDNAPYPDRYEGSAIVYQGHDAPRSKKVPHPETVDQPEKTRSGTLTENGKFGAAAREFKLGNRPPEPVRVYQKLRKGLWSYNGLFNLVDAWREKRGRRLIVKFKLVATENRATEEKSESRVIPARVKATVWKRDKGRCVICGKTEDLHFDHVIPFSKGGSSTRAANMQLLCARHNLKKSARIE